MAEAAPSIFNKKATDKLRSPDDLDKYVRVTNPSVWITLGACIALVAGILAWAVFGTVATSVQATGTVVNRTVLCFLSAEDAAKVHAGDIASVGGESMTVSSVASMPNSLDEARSTVPGDYLLSVLFTGDWAYRVTFDGDTSELDELVPLTVNITTERMAPISLILPEWG